MSRRQQPMPEKSRTSRSTTERPGEPCKPDADPDLLRVALAAYAAHLEKHARVRVPGATTPWGRSARIANLRRVDTR